MASTVTHTEAVTELAKLSGWTRKEVEADPHSAAWACSEKVWQWCHIVEKARER